MLSLKQFRVIFTSQSVIRNLFPVFPDHLVHNNHINTSVQYNIFYDISPTINSITAQIFFIYVNFLNFNNLRTVSLIVHIEWITRDSVPDQSHIIFIHWRIDQNRNHGG